MIVALLLAAWAAFMGWPCTWRVRSIPAPVPAWLQNDAELEALACRIVLAQWRANNSAIVRLWRGAGIQVQNLARYRK